jgi:Quercetinase C-terminal cupin domain
MCPQRFSSFGLGRASPGTLRVGVRSPSRSLIAPATLSPWQVDGERKAVELRCDAEVLGASLFAGIVTNYDSRPGDLGYLVVSSGVVNVNGLRATSGEGIVLREEAAIRVEALQDTELVFVITSTE